MRRILALSLKDLKDIGRDPMLAIALFVPVIITCLIRFVIPLLTEILMAELHFDLTIHYPFITGILVAMVPMMMGMLIGFIILDERDGEMLLYYSVTPLTKQGYLIYRIISPVLLSIFLTFVLLPFSELSINYLRVFPVIVLAGLEAPILVLFLGVFAANKVEGLAFSKATGILFGVPMAAYLLNSKWEILLGLFPTYWVLEAFLASFSASPTYWLSLLIGLFIHVIYLYLLHKRFIIKTN